MGSELASNCFHVVREEAAAHRIQRAIRERAVILESVQDVLRDFERLLMEPCRDGVQQHSISSFPLPYMTAPLTASEFGLGQFDVHPVVSWLLLTIFAIQWVGRPFAPVPFSDRRAAAANGVKFALRLACGAARCRLSCSCSFSIIASPRRVVDSVTVPACFATAAIEPAAGLIAINVLAMMLFKPGTPRPTLCGAV